jgi:GTP-binding protein LepA
MQQRLIRNFAIIAHIDHGKSTLADRILELTGAVAAGSHIPQLLDSMDIEQERGITIKAQAVRTAWQYQGETYHFHLVDTPGHVDFHYEVSRSLAACEGALLVVDAAQGIEAQTLANAYLAITEGLTVLPVLNKIDLPSAEPDRVADELEELLGIEAATILRCSAKTGAGVAAILDRLVEAIPEPSGDPAAPLRALIFDSQFDPYRGVIAAVRVVDGQLERNDPVSTLQMPWSAAVEELGVFTPTPQSITQLGVGDVGYIITGIKDLARVRVGDTITSNPPATTPLPGYREIASMVFAGLYPLESQRFGELRDALAKLALNDAALHYEPESSQALGFGFRCGFLGLLHLEIVLERLAREYDLMLLSTAPSVGYQVTLSDGTLRAVRAPAEMPDSSLITVIEEPFVRASILAPGEYVGTLMQLCQERRGQQQAITWLSEQRVEMIYDLPLSEIVLDFFDALKSRTRGYASLDYELLGFRPSTLVKVNIRLAGETVDALSVITHTSRAERTGRALCSRLKEEIPRQQYEVAIQAAIGERVIARETVRAYRKDVTAKLYGGDITRKRKLLEKQKSGKARMKRIGRIELPPEAFLAVMRLGDE